MAMAVSATRIAPEHSAIPSSLLNVCFVLFVINASFFPTAYFAHWWIFDDKGLGIPTDFCVCSRRYGSRNGCGIYAPIRRTSFSPVSSLLCNRKHSAQSWSWLELSISRRHAPFLSRPWLIARSKLSFPVYLVHWPILFGPAARFISAVERHGGNRGGSRLRHRRRNLRRVHLQHGLSQRRWRRARASESIA